MTSPDTTPAKHSFDSPEELRDLLNTLTWPTVSIHRTVEVDGADVQEVLLSLMACPHCGTLILPTSLDESDEYRFKEIHIDYEVSVYTQIYIVGQQVASGL